MKKLVLACALAACALTVSTATAREYCCPPSYDPCCNDGNFEGLYIGGNVGVISHVAHRNDLDGFLTDNSGWTTIDTNAAGGVRAGYDWQCNNSLFGVVGDWNWTGVDRFLHDNPNSGSDDNRIHDCLNWYTTMRARAGLAVCDALVYVTGGAVAGRFETKWRDDPQEFHWCDTRWGWTGGAGAEFKFWCNWSIGLEFLYMHFADCNKEYTTVNNGNSTYRFGHNDSFYTGQLTLSYRFDDLGCCFW